MSVLCCCRSPKTICQQVDPVRDELLSEPPQVELGETPYSQNNVEETSVQPILTASVPSRLDSPTRQAMIDPASLNVEDSDDEDSIFRNFRNSSISTIEVIKKFIRRRSPAFNAKARSHSAVVGNSDEEIARRAELKRIMHKRIQEELRSEKGKGSTAAGESESPRKLHQGAPRDTIEFSVDEMNEIKANGLKCTSPEFIPLALPVDEGQMMALRRRSGDSESTGHSGDTIRTRYKIIVMERCSPSQMPLSPELAPVHLPSLHDSCSTHSWRLSCSAEQITSILGIREGSTHRSSESNETDNRINDTSKKDNTGNNNGDTSGAPENPIVDSNDMTGQDPSHSADRISQEADRRAVDIATKHHTNREVENEQVSDTTPHNDSSLDLWLRSQESQSSFGVSGQRDKNLGLAEITASHSQGLDAMASDDKTEPADILRKTEVHEDVVIENRLSSTWTQSQDSQPVTEKKSCDLAEMDDPNVPKTRDLTTSQESSSHYTSSRHTRVPNSTQPNHKSSRLSLKDLLGSTKGTGLVPISNIHRLATSSRKTETDRSGVSSYKTAPTGLPITHLVSPKTHPSHSLGMETESLAISDTGSFTQRENELKSVEQRFGPAHCRRNRTLPTSSRFREEFDEPQATPREKPSLFSKLRLPPIGKERRVRDDPGKAKSEGETVKDYFLRKPQGLVNRTPVVTRQSPETLDEDEKPHIEERATGVWQRAIRTEADSHHSPRRETLSSKLHAYLRDHDKETDASSSNAQNMVRHVRESSAAEKTDDDDGISRSHSPKHIIRSSLQPPVEFYHDRTPASDISSRLLNTWSRQLSTPSPQFRPVPSTNIEHRAPRRLLTPPKSWAKWPSHNRAERSGPAGAGDRVISRDFAVQVTSNAGDSVVTMERNTTQSKLGLKSVPRKFSNSLGRAMKQSLTKITPTKEGSLSMKESREKRNGFLEYPELELLPTQGGYKDLQALECQIDTMKHGTANPEGRPRSINSINPPLSVRLAHDVHNLRCENNSENNGCPTISSQHYPKPVTTLNISATANNKLELPPSSASYDDCIPKHMLDDNDSIKSYKTVLVRRSKSQRVGQRSGASVASNRHKYMTWHGRSMRQPVLLQSTLDFGAELDDMLTSARAKAIQASNSEDTQKETMVGA